MNQDPAAERAALAAIVRSMRTKSLTTQAEVLRCLDTLGVTPEDLEAARNAASDEHVEVMVQQTRRKR